MSEGFEPFATHTARRTDDYLVQLDEYRRHTDDAQMMIAHISVFKWAPSILKQMRREWALFRGVCNADIYAYPQDDTPQWRKFIEAVGFTYFKQVNCSDGLSRPLYISRATNAGFTKYPIVLDEYAGLHPAA